MSTNFFKNERISEFHPIGATTRV